MSDLLHCPAVLALELAADAPVPRRRLMRDEAAALADLLAADLDRLLPGAAALHLALSGALYDAAQLLRPGFPLWAQLGDLAEAAPGEGARVVAFGSHADAMPLPVLEPETELGDGPLLLLPWSLFGAPAEAAVLGQRMEEEFVARGEAGPALADFVMRTLGTRLEHARYLTRHDLCALACVQLEHAGLAAAWDLLEPALLDPSAAREAFSARGRTWRYADGLAHTASPGFADWLAAQGRQLPVAERAHAWAGALFELRQFLALFAAHALPVQFDGVEALVGGAIETLAPLAPELGAVELVAHEAPGLGVVALGAVQRSGGGVRTLALAYPLAPDGLPRLRAELAARYATGGALERLGRIVLDEVGEQLAAPLPSAH